VEEEALLAAVGQRIRALRKRAHLSIETLAGDAGLHPTYVSAIELGKRNPSLGVLHRIANALDLELSALLDLSETRDAASVRKDLRGRLKRAELNDLKQLVRILDALR